MEVIYTGLMATPEQIAHMAIDEDVEVIALSLLNGAHLTAFPKVVQILKKERAGNIAIVGGGIIPEDDKPLLEMEGITGNFGPGTPMKTIINHIKSRAKKVP